MVMVLPWHDPVRIAESFTVLDHISQGRVILGIGRGLGRVEFDGFRVPMGESRERFVESAEMLLAGLERGYVEYDGQWIRQPRAAIRPAPSRTFRGRTYAAAVSPESMPIMAKLGVGILVIPQKPWDVVTAELDDYRRVYREHNGTDAPPTTVAGWTFVDPDADRAREMAVKYIGGYWDTVLRHYELTSDHLSKTKGYEHYGRMSEIARAAGGTDALTEFFLSLQVWGTPDQCVEKIHDIRSRLGANTFIGVFSYAGMPPEEAPRNLRCFATDVLPQLNAS
jgi:alkanesulfonate monooxygenase SsuD/methylene tetrahydromethanopterin reductase-like flavin-dependent oxidoreductase (luciferase family)